MQGLALNRKDLFGIKTHVAVYLDLPISACAAAGGAAGYRWFTKTDEPEYNGETDELFSSAG